MNGPRVVMVAPTPFFSDRGCHVRILEEARALESLGARVTVCTYFLGDSPAGIDIRRTGSLPGYRKTAAGPAWGKLLLDGALLRLTRRVVRESRPDVLHAHLHEGMAIAAAVRGPRGMIRVLDVQGGLADETLDHGFLPDVGPIRRPLEGIEGFLNRRADAVVTSHAAAADSLRERFGVDPGRVHLVGDAAAGDAPPDPERMAAYRERFGLDPDEPILLFAGHLGEHQGTHFLFPLARAIRGTGARLLVLGYPEARWRDRAKAEGLADVMSFPGRFPYRDLPSLFALGVVALSPKISLTEGNQKLHAYLRAGLPVVAFDTPATGEILGGAGVVVPRGDGGAFTAACLELLNDPEKRARMAAASRDRAGGLETWKDVGARILEAYGRAGLDR